VTASAVSIPRRRFSRIIPVAFLMYTIAFMDRLNIGMALPYMEKDLHFNASVAGLASGILFIGYLFFQMPGGHLAEKWSAKKFILIALFVWGAFAMLTGLVTNVTELLIVRFLVGVAEGGVWPATLVLIGHWFPREERARARNLWVLCLPFASVMQAPLSGYILSVSNWHWLFVIEGFIPWVWAIVWAIAIVDWPHQASWLAPEERTFIETSIAAEREDREMKNVTLGQALGTKAAWMYTFAYVCQAFPGYGIAFFLPSLLKKAGFPIGTVGILTALPFAMAIIGILVHGFLSDRSMKRRIHVMIPMGITGASLIISSLFQNSLPILSIILLIIAGWGLYAFLGPFWTMVEQTFPADVAGPLMGFVNAIGNLGGFFSATIVGALVTATKSFELGFLFLGVMAGLMLLFMSQVRIKEGEAARVTPTSSVTA
jgi:sugar phosphate permease